LYDFLAAVFLRTFPSSLQSHEFAERFSFLIATLKRRPFTYGDAQTDDARLVLELIAGAMAAGAVCVITAN